ncbi:MAG: hypothetical protein M0R00_07445 [Candidatus Omnitrophica bacterium]|jgi:hypothetical protein|nr:hypothetical protein [Candidatus Omnitrophota bacterium]
MRFFRRGQSLIEIAFLIGVVGLAIIGMEVYIRRGVQGKVKDLTNYIISDQQAPDEDAADSTGSSSIDSTLTAKEFQGGGRQYTSQEKIHSESSQ